jgi:hypothetical protein
VRDSDFQRGINMAVANKWITLHVRDRYRFILTDIGYAHAGQSRCRPRFRDQGFEFRTVTADMCGRPIRIPPLPIPPPMPGRFIAAFAAAFLLA